MPNAPDLRHRSKNGQTTDPEPAPPQRAQTIHEVLGAPKHGIVMQGMRTVSFVVYFFTCSTLLHCTQLLGVPLYFVSKDWFYAWIALTKQYFGLLATTMTQWWSPTIVRISGDKSVAGLLRQKEDGMLEVDFGERIVLMANHQIYTDWLYLWWTAYTNAAPTHGHIYIILKDSLRYLPLLGPAMMFYGFIFMSRKWATDESRLRYRLQKLNTPHHPAVSGRDQHQQLDPMWLVIFPEGTVLSAYTRDVSKKFSEKSGIPDMKHQLLPHHTGLAFCLQELRSTVPYLYDCTIAYEPFAAGSYSQDIFTLPSVYFQGRAPISVNMHWRRFAIKDMPLDDKDAMQQWILQRWREKDALIDAFQREGRFPAVPEAVHIEGAPQEKEWKTPYINTEVQLRNVFEVLSIFAPVCAAAMVGRVGVQIKDRIFGA